MIRTILSLFTISLFCGCAGKADSFYWTLEEPVKVVLDESKTVLRSLPRQLRFIDDSTVAAITNRRQLSWYNIITGKNTENFNPGHLSMDSLLNATYNEHYRNKRHYQYNQSEAAGMSDAGYQMYAFAYDNSNYYLQINFETEVRYTNDTAGFNSQMKTPELRALRKKTPGADFHFMEYAEFLIVLNKDHSLNRILPMYRRKVLGTHFPSFQLGFAAYEGNLYVPLAINFTAESYKKPLGKEITFYSFCKLGITDTSSGSLLLSSRDMDYSEHTLNRYLEERTFQPTNEGLYVCNGKEIMNIKTNKKIDLKKVLSRGEWINNFYLDDQRIFLCTSTYVAKAHPTDLDRAYGIDSVAGKKIHMLNRQGDRKQAFVLEKGRSNAVPSLQQLLYFERDDEHYYLTRTPLDEK